MVIICIFCSLQTNEESYEVIAQTAMDLWAADDPNHDKTHNSNDNAMRMISRRNTELIEPNFKMATKINIEQFED